VPIDGRVINECLRLSGPTRPTTFNTFLRGHKNYEKIVVVLCNPGQDLSWMRIASPSALQGGI